MSPDRNDRSSSRASGAARGKKAAAGSTSSTRGGTDPRPWSRGWRRWVKWLTALGFTGLVLGLAAFAVAYATTDIPSPNEGFEAQTTYVYYADGKTVLGKFAEQDRTNVELDDVPVPVRDAVIAAEDRTFRTNKGLDPKGIVRAAFNNASGGDTQGASTITQQYVKVLYLSQERTLTRKIKEAVLSLKIQRQQSKDEILEGYLNTIYFGRGAYGIEAAAQAYFGKSASDLGVREGAALAAIINNPNGYDPADGKQARTALRDRYRYVIDGMEEMGTLPAEVAGTKRIDRLPRFPEIGDQSRYGGQRGHVLKMVRAELNAQGFSDSEIDSGGLRVTTTFTKAAMDAAAAGVTEVAPKKKGLHVAVASVDPRSGALRGIFAGQDYLRSQLNWALEGGAPGSTFKPFSLAAGLDYGYSLESSFNGSSPLEVAGTEFSNQGEGGGTSYGQISLLTATEKSVNTAYVEMVDAMDGGVGRVIDTAVAMGIPRDAPGLDETLSIVLGSATVSPVDMANAYGTIADGGQAKEVYLIERVKTAAGETRYKHSGETTQAISEEVAADTSYALQQVASVGTGTNANVIGRPIAGKTGTATTDGGRVRSSWFVGYTPQLSTAVMYSRGNGNEPLDGFLDTFYGGEYPARTWAAVMGRALEGQEILEFPPPADLEHTAPDHAPYVPPPPPEKDDKKSDDAEKGDKNGNKNGNGGNGGGAEPSPSPSPSTGGGGSGSGGSGSGGTGTGDTTTGDSTTGDTTTSSGSTGSGSTSQGSGSSTTGRRVGGG